MAGRSARPFTLPSTTSASVTSDRNRRICSPSSDHRSCVRHLRPATQPGAPSSQRVALMGSSTASTMSEMAMRSAGRVRR